MGCLTSAKMSMFLDILKPSSSPEANPGSGKWTYTQDPVSGAVERQWVDDDPNTSQVEGNVVKNVPCMARGILGSGIKGVGTTESFDKLYENIEWIKVNVPADCGITQRDRITRIRDKNGSILWKESEQDGNPATVFNVMGITPIPNPFGAVLEYQILAKRAAVQ